MYVPSMDLRQLPVSARIVLTCFLLVISAGYLMALANILYRHQLADEKEGLSLNDLRAVYHGLNVVTTQPAAARSKMLTMVQPGGEMRKHLTAGPTTEVRTLIEWLQNGAKQEDFNTAPASIEGSVSAARVIQRRCLRCHNAEDGEKKDAPYGPDLFTVEYDMVRPYAVAGEKETAVNTAERQLGPQSVSHLVLVSHQHMLGIPVYTLLVAALFLFVPWPRRIKGPVLAAPMAALMLDFALWWLSRPFESAVFVLLATGAVYGLFFAIQTGGVLWTLWAGKTSSA